MRRFCLAFFPALAILVAGCASPTPAATPPPPATSNPADSKNARPAGVVTASAVVAPSQVAEMGFLVSAIVKEISVKAGDKVKAGQPLIVLDTPDLKESMLGAEAGLRSAQAELAYWKYPRKGEPPERRQVAQAQLDQAQAVLDAAKDMLAQGTLTAPYDGTVVSIDVVPGELVQPGQVVAVIGDLDHLQIETLDFSERDVAGVQIGQVATVRLEAFAQELSGKVIAIAPMGERSGGDVVFKVTIQLDAPPQGLRWGMSADVEMQTKE
jgi:multidrug efflux pump subunit AcrA (membrane-fusion protein)